MIVWQHGINEVWGYISQRDCDHAFCLATLLSNSLIMNPGDYGTMLAGFNAELARARTMVEAAISRSTASAAAGSGSEDKIS